jgi:hypothetical protein
LEIFNAFDTIEVNGKRIGHGAHRDPIVCARVCLEVLFYPVRVLASGVHSSAYGWSFAARHNGENSTAQSAHFHDHSSLDPPAASCFALEALRTKVLPLSGCLSVKSSTLTSMKAE